MQLIIQAEHTRAGYKGQRGTLITGDDMCALIICLTFSTGHPPFNGMVKITGFDSANSCTLAGSSLANMFYAADATVEFWECDCKIK